MGQQTPRHPTLRMPPEPPERYVAFVAAHLGTLTREAGRLVGDERHAAEVYPEALTDVALRWPWWEVLGGLRRAGTPESFLRRSLAAHARRWRDSRIYEVEVQVLPSGPGPGPRRLEVDDWAHEHAVRRPAPAPWTSVALRRAQLLEGTERRELRPVAEAAIAWWHAYERYRGALRLAGLALLVLSIVAAAQLGSALGR